MPQEPLPGADTFLFRVEDSPHARRYLRLFDRAVSQAFDRFDTDSGLAQHEVPEGSPGVPPEVADLDRFERKKYISPLNNWAYRVGRNSAATIGAFGYAYSQPLSSHFQIPEILRAARSGLEAFRRVQAPSGEFVFTPIRFCSVYGTHEMAWRLECLLTAFLCVKEALTPEEQVRYWSMLANGMEFLRAVPCDHRCNRGVVWCAVMAMCWRATGDERFREDAAAVWAQVAPAVFHESGEILEGCGPCNGYSMISFEYLLRYRLAMDDPALDPVIEQATDWATRTYTDRFVTFRGVSTRQDLADATHKAVPLLAAFERLSAKYPWYAAMADQLLDRVDAAYPGAPAQHGGIAWMAAAAAHRPAPARNAVAGRRGPSVRQFSSQATRYVTVEQEAYQTLVTFRSLPPRKGLQTWAVRGETPFIFPEDDAPSRVKSWGYDSSRDNVTEWDTARYDDNRCPGLTARVGDFVASYLITPRSLIVVYSFDTERDFSVRWCGSNRHMEAYRVENGRVTAVGTAGELHWWTGDPVVAANSLAVEFRATTTTQAFAFAAGGFRRIGGIVAHDGLIRLHWIDGAGDFAAIANHSRAARPVPPDIASVHDEGVTRLQPCETRVFLSR